MKMFMDAKSLMFDVDNFNFLTYNNAKDEKRIHGLFISHKYRMEAKEESTLGSFLHKKKDLHPAVIKKNFPSIFSCLTMEY